jgi:hypothetical protein
MIKKILNFFKRRDHIHHYQLDKKINYIVKDDNGENVTVGYHFFYKCDICGHKINMQELNGYLSIRCDKGSNRR